MDEITLQSLLEAGCHFGHKAERWNPKASEFIYAEKDGIHIIDLAQTKAGLEAAAAFVKETAAGGGTVLFVATKRQARGIVKELAEAAGAPYLVERWIGGFLTNWDEVHKNIQKINRLAEERKTGGWKKFPKHEQTKLGHYLDRLKVFYGGVLTLNAPPAALFIVDVHKEDSAVREAVRREIPIIAMVDTNSDPTGIDYVIAANDDAVGSIRLITNTITSVYREGREKAEKDSKASKTELQQESNTSKASKTAEKRIEEKKPVVEETKKKSEIKKAKKVQ